MNKRKQHKTLTPEQFNMLVDELDSYNIEYAIKSLACTAQLETRSIIYDCSLTGEKRHIINVGNIGNIFYKAVDLDVLKGKYGYHEFYNSLDQKKVLWDYEVAYGYSYSDPYYSRKQLKCWSYDINSAFAYAMLKQMPDTRQQPRYDDFVQPGEIGFYKMGGATTDVGDWAEIIFPLMDSPFKEFIMKYYNKKREATDREERRKWKDFLNIPTGLLARTNIFIRNAIIYYSNKYIRSWIDENTVYCNVDCIISLTPRPDLPIGDDIGQFKKEHECDDFKYIKSCEYQWGKECHYSGIPKSCLTDIENTKNWTSNLKYKLKGNKIYENSKIKN